ncbi:alpha/beta fold hydrolase [Microbacterium sp. ARD31]|uniref:alpha/beta fold hydrolase n=1 Tax=Microbacterium sp. ARD31 TaxID=2962576 RepID=UPI00288287F6|nr:alpha/beta fold hydrolase [Microbacterium sp. ARD31]MDT0186057.1 alpha/beta fold hydrolase [Microbacterium sp. ARD31]
MLLQHGYGEYAERFVSQYHELIPNLLAAGIDVYAIDLPGHGRSPGRRGSLDVREGARHHLAAKRALAARGPVFLFGHSLGGLVTAHTVVEDQTNVRGVVLMSPALPMPAGPVLHGLATALAAVAPHAPAPLRAAPASSLSRRAENADRYAADPLIYKGRLTNLTARTSLLTAEDVWRRASGWQTPTLILHGASDRSTDPGGSMRIFEEIASTDKTLELVRGGHHELLNDLDRDRVRTIALDWTRLRIPASR